MIDFIIQYWVEVLCGLAATGIGFLIKRYIKLSKKEKEQGRKVYYENLQKDIEAKNQKMIDKIVNKSINEDAKIQDQVNTLRAGVLSLQGREFKADCRRFLQEDYEISLEDWEEIQEEHETYNALGGNHRGDELYELVKEKMKKNLK